MSYPSGDDALARLLAEPALEVAPRLLGSVFWSGGVGVRLTEVEAYHGQGQDPGSHAHRGRSARNGSMFEGGGTLYVYLSYGIHRCVNIVCGPEGYASGVLLRAGEVVSGLDEAHARRTTSRTPTDLARGPGRLGSALGVDLEDDGTRLVADAPGQEARFRLRLPSGPVGAIAVGPRVGVSGRAGGDDFPWRFSLEGDPTVSPYRAAVPRRLGGA
jgi:DNA-3-methyladenine glycosylase